MSVIRITRRVKIRTRDEGSAIRGSFRELTRSYFARERNWEFIVEMLFFAVLAAISAWPILAAANALNEFLQRAMI